MAERQVLTDSIVKISKELAALEERATEVERTNAVLEERSNAMHEEIRQTKEEFERMEKAQVTAKHQNIEMGHNIMTLELELQKQHFEARQAQAAMIKALWCVVKCGLPQRSIQHHKHCQFETGMELELALTLSCSQAHPQAGTLPRKVSAQRLFILNPDPNTPCIFYSRYKKGSHQAARAHDLPALTPVTPLVTSSSFDARLAARRRKSLRSRNATVNHFVIPYARVKRMVLLRTVTKKMNHLVLAPPQKYSGLVGSKLKDVVELETVYSAPAPIFPGGRSVGSPRSRPGTVPSRGDHSVRSSRGLPSAARSVRSAPTRFGRPGTAPSLHSPSLRTMG